MGRLGLLVCVAILGFAFGALALAGERSGKDERIVGTKKADVLEGHGGDDKLIGGGGADVLIGGPGADKLQGDGGYDSFNMRGGEQVKAGGPDRIDARDGHPDAINCGAGADLAIVDDVEDGVYDCEEVIQP